MATNDFIGFASSGAANVMSQADYAAAHEQLVGVQPGMASSAMANKVWRQGANMAAVIGELIKNHGNDALDNGDLATLYNALLLSTASTTLAGLMSAADKAALDGVPTTYFPLSGGALSGQVISRDVTTSGLRLLGGTNNENGSYLNLWGKDSESAAGTFNLIARKTTAETAILTGSTDGTLTWNAKDISPVKIVSFDRGRTIAEYVNKLQLNARLIGVSNGDTVLFDRPFLENPCVVLCQSNNMNGVFAPYDISTTGFKIFSTFGTPAYGYYFAIGKGV